MEGRGCTDTDVVHRQAKALLGSGRVGEALGLIRRHYPVSAVDAGGEVKVDGNTHQSVLDGTRDIINTLEVHLESKAYTWESPTHSNDTNDLQEVLRTICSLHKRIALASLQSKETLELDDEEVADNVLDWAMTAKRAGRPREAFGAHFRRVDVLPGLKHLDAVRLLGVRMSNGDGGEFAVEEVPTKGLFETTLCSIASHENSVSHDAHKSTENAVELGERVARIFADAQYTFDNCHEMLNEVLSTNHDEPPRSSHRIYSANSFFNHRREAWAGYDELSCESSLKVLAFLFLFGVSLEQSAVAAAIGDGNIETLFQAGILRSNPADEALMVGEVQIYPLDLDTFEENSSNDARPVYLMTDWPMESMRLPRDAVMAIGYDSLELVALASGIDVFASTERDGNAASRVLDLCCGCGIQGIVAAKRSSSWHNHNVQTELLSMDINGRACHFAMANACLNGLAGDNLSSIRGVEADSYVPASCSKREGAAACHTIGRFDCILSNPPFVAVPLSNIDGMAPALYSAGGGEDGMGLLRRILKDCFSVLKDGNDGSLLVVTELPNIEDSCNLLASMLPGPSNVRVAYIEDDVETADEYAKEREVEAGYAVSSRDWTPTDIIKNRALALISISRSEAPRQGLFCYNEPKKKESISFDAADEEDQFLSTRGIRFARKHLL